MADETASSRLDAHFAKAKELALGGKRRQPDELWRAEALARGDASSLQQMSEFVVSLQAQLEPTRSTGFSDLADVLHSDIETTARQRTSSAASGHSAAVSLSMAIAWIVGGGLVGGIVGRLTESPDEMLPSLDPVVGAVIGVPIGALAGLVVCAAWHRW